MESRETENTTALKCSHLLLVRVLLEILGHVACCFQPQETERTIKDKERGKVSWEFQTNYIFLQSQVRAVYLKKQIAH